MKGFVILALNSPIYMQFAANLAASLKIHSSYPVTLITDSPHLLGIIPVKTSRLFDDVKTIDAPHPFYVKTKLYQLSPYEETIYLDADSYCIANPDSLFDGAPFKTILQDRHPCSESRNMAWGKVPDLASHYGWKPTDTFYEINSSYMHWTKGPVAKAIFDLAEDLYASNYYPDWYKKAFRFYPDELAFNSALAFMQYPVEKGAPVFYRYHMSARPLPHEIEARTFITLPGIDTTHAHLWKYYYRRVIRDCGKHFRPWQGFKPRKTGKANATHRATPYRGMRKRDPNRLAELVSHAKEVLENENRKNAIVRNQAEPQ